MVLQVLTDYDTLLLLISYKFAKGFWAITILLLFLLAETFIMCVNVFYKTRNKMSAWLEKKMRNFPIEPHYKNVHFCNVMSIDMTLQKWAIFIHVMGGVYGENRCLLSDQAEILFLFI